MWNNDKFWGECDNLKEQHVCEKDHIWNPAICTCKNSKYLGIITDDSMI